MVKAWKVVDEWRNSFCALGSYAHIYTIGAHVFADKDTLGIFCFDTLNAAKAFIEHIPLYLYTQILEVESIGDGIRPATISNGVGQKYLDEFYAESSVHNGPPPDGTICFPSIKVLT